MKFVIRPDFGNIWFGSNCYAESVQWGDKFNLYFILEYGFISFFVITSFQNSKQVPSFLSQYYKNIKCYICNYFFYCCVNI